MIWEKLHQFFIHTPQHVQSALTNDDLAGFFNSVPQVRIAEAVRLVAVFDFNRSLFLLDLMVNISPAFGQIKSISGSTKRAGEPGWWKSIDIQDVPDVVQVSFDCGTFQACGARWKQTRWYMYWQSDFTSFKLTSSSVHGDWLAAVVCILRSCRSIFHCAVCRQQVHHHIT